MLDIEHGPNSPEDIVKEANKWVGKTHNYHIWSENCEHFVTSLRNNEPVSKQVGGGFVSKKTSRAIFFL